MSSKMVNHVFVLVRMEELKILIIWTGFGSCLSLPLPLSPSDFACLHLSSISMTIDTVFTGRGNP